MLSHDRLDRIEVSTNIAEVQIGKRLCELSELVLQHARCPLCRLSVSMGRLHIVPDALEVSACIRVRQRTLQRAKLGLDTLNPINEAGRTRSDCDAAPAEVVADEL